jgi:hypothetical protein
MKLVAQAKYPSMLADEHVGDVTIPTQVIEYNQAFHQAD